MVRAWCVVCVAWCVSVCGGGEEVYGDPDAVFEGQECLEGPWHVNKLGDEVCMKELGCFRLGGDYFHPQFRPCNALPHPRALLRTRFVLFTRRNVLQGRFLRAHNETAIRESGFDALHPTRILVHGYRENPLHDAWVLVLMKEFLNQNASNVLVVDWSGGSGAPYLQAVANARVVGAEIARLVNGLKKFGNLTTSTLHIVGHGLGAHVAGYAGQSILPAVGRITGLDPAYKSFCNMPESVRLDSGDADFVDVVHTAPKAYDEGHGGCHKMGHVDFFPDDQGVVSQYQSHHQQAAHLFISSIRNRSCSLIGYWCRSFKAFQRGECGDCGPDGARCAPLGFRADAYRPHKDSNFSTMFLVTAAYPNFCVFEYRVRLKLEKTDEDLQNRKKSGNLLLLMRGERKPLFVPLRFYSTHAGEEYTFLVTSSSNIGTVRNVSLRWEEAGAYDERWLRGEAVWHFAHNNVQVNKLNLTRLNFQPNARVLNPTEVELCKSNDTNDPPWITYSPNCS